MRGGIRDCAEFTRDLYVMDDHVPADGNNCETLLLNPRRKQIHVTGKNAMSGSSHAPSPASTEFTSKTKLSRRILWVSEAAQFLAARL
jgi:hypothetical protein